MNDFVIAIVGGLIGSIITSIVSIFIFRAQAKKESNRHFLQEMLKCIQNIYFSTQKNIRVKEDDLNYLLSFRVVGLKQFEDFCEDIIKINELIISYNDGVDQTLSSTETSSLQITSKTNLDEKLKTTIKKLYKLT